MNSCKLIFFFLGCLLEVASFRLGKLGPAAAAAAAAAACCAASSASASAAHAPIFPQDLDMGEWGDMMRRWELFW